MNCITIDDEQMSREILSIMILNSLNLVLVNEFTNAIDAIKYLNEGNKVDVIFLDIHMPNFSGIDFIKTIKNSPQIILVTTDKNFALDAFKYDFITDYLVKPIQSERFEAAVQKIKFKNYNNVREVSSNLIGSDIYVNIDKRLIKIDVSSINLIQAKGDYICIKTETKNYVVHTTLKKIEQKLPKSVFVKVHRSFIINLNKIIDIQDNTVLIGLEVVPISKNNRENLMQHITQL